MILRWTPLRLALAALGAVALAAGGAGTYVALKQGGGAIAEDTPVLRMHASPRPLPELAFVDGKGKPVTLADFRGRTVLLNVWATWCPPCREEMPSLDRLQKSLGGPGFEVVALSIDAGGAPVVERFYKEIGIASLAIYVDSGMRAASQLATPGVPTTLLIDARGRELGRHAGPAQWDSPEALRVISSHMGR
jgi:thiol-disulfide isomerase/thioredoxin